ncbi:MAG TPA: hypothetical protein VMO81_04270 [Aestuariivirgaceae bacterium]|nr:hypothetical protein [Aestuariivirgaceae bacterium]
MKRPGEIPAETSSDNEVTDVLAKMKAMGPAPYSSMTWRSRVGPKLAK